ERRFAWDAAHSVAVGDVRLLWRTWNAISGAGVFSSAAHLQVAYRQLSGRHQALCRAATPVRLYLLRGDHVRHDRVARYRLTSARLRHTNDNGPVSLLQKRSRKAQPVQSEASRNKHGSSLNLQLRREPRIAEPEDPVEVNGRPAPRECVGRSQGLSGADCGR